MLSYLIDPNFALQVEVAPRNMKSFYIWSKNSMSPIQYHSYPIKNKDNIKFSILIPSWNNLSILKITIESLLKNSDYPHQIIVHVNEGQDGTAAWLAEKGISHTISEKNVGVCYGFNIPSALAISDYVVLSDDDNYFCPGWDGHLLDEIQRQPDNQFCLSGTIIERFETGNKCVIAPYDFGSDEHTFREDDLLAQFDKIPFEDWKGSSWYPLVLHRYTWAAIGGLSIEFTPGMWSDPDFMIKLWHFGIRRFKGIAASRVYHFMSKTTSRIRKNNGRKTFLLKWGVSSHAFMSRILNLGRKESNSTSIRNARTLKHRLKSRLLQPDNILDTRL